MKEALNECLPAQDVVVLTDANVKQYYEPLFPDFPVITIGTGESIKQLSTITEICDKLIELRADRSFFLLGIGGGIVCDITGFVASIYMRGIRFGFVSTTLLSQVDASIGGKNGVNFGGFKNMVGTFNQPEFVICDMGMLKTLPERIFRCGFAEMIKNAVIEDSDYFDYLEANYEKALQSDPIILEKMVAQSVQIKSNIVNRDEKEEGERRILNFGHTFAHAIEKNSGLYHGEAVSIGMVAAAVISHSKGLLSEKDVDRIRILLEHYKLPTDPRESRGKILEAIGKDKKKEGPRLHFVLLEKIGKACLVEITKDDLESFMDLLQWPE
jgi:3-dehydroquinate synthase